MSIRSDSDHYQLLVCHVREFYRFFRNDIGATHDAIFWHKFSHYSDEDWAAVFDIDKYHGKC